MRRTLIITAAVLLLLVAGAGFAYRGQLREAYGKWRRGPVPPAVSRSDAQQQVADVNAAPAPDEEAPATPKPEPTKPTEKPAPAKPTTGLPASYNLSVIFFPQAPAKNWDAMHEDTCEESSMYMLKLYQEDVSSMSVDKMEQLLTDIIDYEKKKYGGEVWRSMNMSVALEVMHEYLGIKNARLLPIKSIDDVKAQIAAGHPVFLPAAGKELHNPNFKGGGPLYHGLVAKGYTANTIITNDPGTRLGADYAYDDDVLWNAIHDWNDGDVMKGAKVMIVIE